MSRVAVVTPTWAPDEHRCRLLCATMDRWLDDTDWHHYVVVDRRDRHRFRDLAGPRRTVVTKQEWVPWWLLQIPRSRRWLAPPQLWPPGGWIVQQIAKLAAAEQLDEDTIMLIDSDLAFTAPLPEDYVWPRGGTRLYRRPQAIDASMTGHVEWIRTADRLLGAERPLDPAGIDDYIGSIIVWDRRTVAAALRRMEGVGGRSWPRLVARERQFSEYLLYGRYIEAFGSARPLVERNTTDVVIYWSGPPLDRDDVRRLRDEAPPGTVAVQIQSTTGSDTSVLAEGFDLRG